MSEQREDLRQAEELGRLKAERLDAALRSAERRERELRFASLVWDGNGAESPGLAAGGGMGDAGGVGGSAGVGGHGWDGSAAEVWRLRQDVERLAAFHQAVQRSRAWRLVQSLRRPFGRAW
jgi:hypothetical protein